MGAQVRYGSIAVGAYYAHQPGSMQPAFTDQYLPIWDRGGARSLTTRRDPMAWRSRWSFGCSIGYGAPGGSDGAAPIGGDMLIPDRFGPLKIQDGNQTLKFVLGMAVDASDVPIANATVQAFRTSDDALAGEGVSRDDGSYAAPSRFGAGAHYIVAYKPGSPDIGGTTVNTLVPTNLDGT